LAAEQPHRAHALDTLQARLDGVLGLLPDCVDVARSGDDDPGNGGFLIRTHGADDRSFGVVGDILHEVELLGDLQAGDVFIHAPVKA